MAQLKIQNDKWKIYHNQYDNFKNVTDHLKAHVPIPPDCYILTLFLYMGNKNKLSSTLKIDIAELEESFKEAKRRL